MHRPFLNRLLLALTAALGGIAQAQAHSPGAITVAVQAAETVKAIAPHRWEPWRGANVRLEANGQLSCYSNNGKDCVWGGSIADANAPGTPPATPLFCGATHESSWQLNGYNDARAEYHWCRSAYATLYAKWQDFTSLGYPYLLSETPEGDTMCYSTDSKTCTPAKDAKPDRKTEVRPLVCGKHLKFLHGATGYEEGDGDDWCRSPRIVLQARDVKLGKYCPTWQACYSYWSHGVSAWAIDDQPALIVRGTRKVAEELQLVGGVFAQKGPIWGDVELGMLVSDHRVGIPHSGGATRPSFYPTTGPFAAALKVSARGQLCYFGGPWTPGQALGSLFSVAHLHGSTDLEGLLNEDAPYRVLGSAKLRENRGVTVRSTDTEATLDEIMIVAARKVPTGDGQYRRIPYGYNCDL